MEKWENNEKIKNARRRRRMKKRMSNERKERIMEGRYVEERTGRSKAMERWMSDKKAV